jgi:hypothetical protein
VVSVILLYLTHAMSIPSVIYVICCLERSHVDFTPVHYTDVKSGYARKVMREIGHKFQYVPTVRRENVQIELLLDKEWMKCSLCLHIFLRKHSDILHKKLIFKMSSIDCHCTRKLKQFKTTVVYGFQSHDLTNRMNLCCCHVSLLKYHCHIQNLT